MPRTSLTEGRLPLVRRYRVGLFLVGLLLLYLRTPDRPGVNTFARWDLTKAIVLDGSFSIDPYVSNTEDWARRDGRYYSNKAPGSSLLGVPVYAVVTRIERWRGLDPRDPRRDLADLHVVDLFVTALPSVLLALLLWRYLEVRGHPTVTAGTVTFAYAVGTIAFPYSTMLWGHQTAAALLFAGFDAISVAGAPLLAGLAFGFAVLTELPVALAGPAFVLFLLARAGTPLRTRLLRTARFLLGGLPAAALLAFYDQACFGSWSTLPTAFLNPLHVSPGEPRLFGVLGVPSLRALWGVSFGAARGLFVISPVLLLAPVGLTRWVRDRASRAEALLAGWVILANVLSTISFNGWWGGWCIGPRYLVPMLPFLAAALAWARPGRLFLALLAVSVVNVVAILVVDPMPPPGIDLLFDHVYPGLGHGRRPVAFAGLLVVAAALFVLARLAPRAAEGATPDPTGGSGNLPASIG